MGKTNELKQLGTWLARMLGFMMLAFVVLLLAFEVYNPYAWRMGPGKPNSVREFRVQSSSGLEKKQVQAFNNIGCLGEPFRESDQRKRVFFIGSSTTLNSLMPFEHQWPTVAMKGASCWFNNAGIDGSGVREWIALLAVLQAYKPDVVVVLYSPRKQKSDTLSQAPRGGYVAQLKRLAFIQSMLVPYVYSLRASEQQEGHRMIDWHTLPYRTKPVDPLDEGMLAGQIRQANRLIEEIQRLGARPIIIAQPTPFGQYTEEGIRVGDLIMSHETQAYEHALADGLEAICQQKQIAFLHCRNFPKTFRYYYDLTHFNWEGNRAFGLYVRDSLHYFITH